MREHTSSNSESNLPHSTASTDHTLSHALSPHFLAPPLSGPRFHFHSFHLQAAQRISFRAVQVFVHDMKTLRSISYARVSFLSEWPRDLPGCILSRIRCFCTQFKPVSDIRTRRLCIRSTYEHLQLRKPTLDLPIPDQDRLWLSFECQPNAESSRSLVRVERDGRDAFDSGRWEGQKELGGDPLGSV